MRNNLGWLKLWFWLSVFLLGAANSEAREKLILFGGGGYNPEAVARFVDWSGGKDAKVLVLPWASDDPEYEYEEVKSVLSDYPTAEVVRGFYADEKAYNKKELIAQIENATGVFLPGGDQVDLMQRINRDPEIREVILKVYHQGTVFAGFSAGTAVASKTMITGRGDFTSIDPGQVETAEGLGLLNTVVIDQHFIARQRQNRLLSVLQVSRETMGIGIDEKMALVIEDEKRGSALGSSYIMVFERKNSPKQFAITLLKNGDTILLP